MVAFSEEGLIIARLFGANSTRSIRESWTVMRTRRMFFLGKHPFLEIASERALTNRSPVAALSKITEGGKPTGSIDIYIYIKRIDRSTEWGNSHPRIREKEISISTCRNGYAAVNRLVAPPPHKYSIKFIRTNISSSRPTRNLITIYGHVLYPVTDSSLRFRYPPQPRFPIVQTIYVSAYESTPYTHSIQSKFLCKNRKP